VLLAIYAGGRSSEVEALRWERDVDLEGRWLLQPGTKTPQSRRKVRIPDPLMPHLVAAKPEAGTGPVVEPWLNIRRDLRAACKRAGIAPVSPNDLRRTFASWMKQQGEDSAVVAKLMSHASTRMVDLVYGRSNEQNYIEAAARLPSFSMPEPVSGSGSKSVTERALPERTGRAQRTPEARITSGKVVPGAGIEPATRGFSVPCSTD
jgi:integrase